MFKGLFSFPLTGEETYLSKLKNMSLDFVNVFSRSHLEEGSLTQPNFSVWLKMLQTPFLIPITKGGFLSSQTTVHDS